MNGALSDLFYRQGRLTALTLGLIMVLGLSAFTTLARQEDPTMTERYGFVRTFLPGASAERVETLITERIEKKLREIPEIKELRSESRTGLSFINVEFEDRVGPELIDVLWSEVRDKVGTLEGELPPGTLTPEVEARGPIATTLAWPCAGRALATLPLPCSIASESGWRPDWLTCRARRKRSFTANPKKSFACW